MTIFSSNEKEPATYLPSFNQSTIETFIYWTLGGSSYVLQRSLGAKFEIRKVVSEILQEEKRFLALQ